MTSRSRLSVVTPTFRRPHEVAALLTSLAAQHRLPDEVVVVDGSDMTDCRTEEEVDRADVPFAVRYVRSGGGAARQRNVGIALATGDFIAFVDDDVRPEPLLFERILSVFDADRTGEIGCVGGCLDDPERSSLRRLRYLVLRLAGAVTTCEPGTYDWHSGQAIPNTLHDPGDSLRRVSLVGTTCAVWRRAVFDGGLRFAPFFRTYSYNEDFHLSLVAGRHWQLYELGAARFQHLESPTARLPMRVSQAHAVINARFMFVDMVPARSRAQELRFWWAQTIDLVGRMALAAAGGKGDAWQAVVGHAHGMWLGWRQWPGRRARTSPTDRADKVGGSPIAEVQAPS